MKTFIDEKLTSDDRGGLFSVGDVVEWINDYGVKFTNKVIGFNYDDEFNKKYNRFVYLDTDCFWFPHDELKLKPLIGGK